MDVLHSQRSGLALPAVKPVCTLKSKQLSKADIEWVVMSDGPGDSAPSNICEFTLVFGDGLIEKVCAEQASRASILLSIRTKLGDEWEETKLAAVQGGVETEQKYLVVYSRYRRRLIPSRDAYLSMPIVAICSKVRHAAAKHKKLQLESDIRPSPNATPESSPEAEVLDSTELGARVQDTYDLDLHTSEGCIAVTSTSLTLGQARLDDLLVDEVLDIYCVERDTRGALTSNIGKDAIFGISSAWVLLLQLLPREFPANRS